MIIDCFAGGGGASVGIEMALDEKGFPIKEKNGEEYKRFIGSMQDLGYDFDCRELIAAISRDTRECRTLIILYSKMDNTELYRK